MALTVAILGRPNVGKSTLFNRLVGRRLALVDDTPGLTRDRRTGEAHWGDLTLALIDTAGLEDVADDSLEGRMQRQTQRAVEDADVMLLLIDARAGLTPLDRYFADRLRGVRKPVVLVANKCEGRNGAAGLLEAYALGLGEPVAVSAAHGDGVSDLLEVLAAHAAALGSDGPDEAGVAGDSGGAAQALAPETARPVRLAIVGRPNVGKSTLVNALIGEERLLTGPEPGVTRDAVDVDWHYRGRAVRLVDTAGLRRKARIADRLERLAAGDALDAIRLAEVVVVVVDAQAPLERQDLAVARHVAEEGRALVIAVNKWDLVDRPGPVLRDLRERLEQSLPQVRGVPLVTLSALRRRGLEGLMDRVLAIYDLWNRRVATGPLNRWLGEAVQSHPPPLAKGRRLKLRYITQIKARPPTFALWVSRPGELPDSYARYLVNGLRQAFDLPGVPVRLLLRKGRNPYATT